MRNPFFKCPNCDALYQVIKTEGGPKTSDREIECLVCGAPLAAREDEFVLKYFLLRTANRKKKVVAKARPLSGHAGPIPIIRRAARAAQTAAVSTGKAPAIVAFGRG
jgi:hypothetical protein